MSHRLPNTAVILGVAGLIPFVAGAIATLSASDEMRALFFVQLLIAYGAVILAFLGGVHWGFVLEGPALESPALESRTPESLAVTTRRDTARLVGGVLPSLVGWAALIVSLLGSPAAALAILIAGFVAFTVTEAELRRRTLVPAGYMWLRWGLSVVVVLVLATVLTLRLIGARIFF